MLGCLGQSRPAQDADAVARAVVAAALAALAVIHIVDLQGVLQVIPRRADDLADRDPPLRPVR